MRTSRKQRKALMDAVAGVFTRRGAGPLRLDDIITELGKYPYSRQYKEEFIAAFIAAAMVAGAAPKYKRDGMLKIFKKYTKKGLDHIVAQGLDLVERNRHLASHGAVRGRRPRVVVPRPPEAPVKKTIGDRVASLERRMSRCEQMVSIVVNLLCACACQDVTLKQDKPFEERFNG